MSKFSKTLELVIKHWPSRVDGTEPMVRKFADIAALGGLEEQDIAEFCEQLSDFQDEAFQRGINAAHRSYQI